MSYNANVWPLIIFGATYMLIRVLGGAGKKTGSSRPHPHPQARQHTPSNASTGKAQGVHWEASREEIDRFLDMGNRPVVRPGAHPPHPSMPPGAQRTGRNSVVQPTQSHRPVPPPMPPRQRQRKPTSPLQQILQVPAQLEAERQRLAQQRHAIDNERQRIAQQMREIEHRRKTVESAARGRSRKPIKRAVAAKVGRPTITGLPFREPADLRRAVVLAEVLGPPKAARYGRKFRAGLV